MLKANSLFLRLSCRGLEAAPSPGPRLQGRGQWNAPESPAPVSLHCPAFPPHSHQHTEMPLSLPRAPPWIRFMNLVDFYS